MRSCFWLLSVLTVLVLALACDDSPTSPEDAAITFETVVASSSSGFSSPRYDVIRDAGEWGQTWNILHAGQSPLPPLPGIDFEREMVMLAAMGTGNNGCFRVEVSAITLRASGGLDVEVTELEPGTSCSCTQAITQPVHVVRLQRIEAGENILVDRRPLSC